MRHLGPTQKDLYYDQAVALYFREHLTIRMISKKIPVSKSVIHRWISNFAGEKNADSNTDMKKRIKSSKPQESVSASDSGDVDAMKAEIERLKKELSMESMRADLYSEMINVAEKQFDIKIRKKAGTKR